MNSRAFPKVFYPEINHKKQSKWAKARDILCGRRSWGFFQILFLSKTELPVYQNWPKMHLIRTANCHSFNSTYHFLSLFRAPVNLKAGILCICYTLAKKKEKEQKSSFRTPTLSVYFFFDPCTRNEQNSQGLCPWEASSQLGTKFWLHWCMDFIEKT